MKWRRVAHGGMIVILLAPLPVLIPASPFYLPELLTSESDHEGRSARSWARDLDDPDPEARRNAAFALGTIAEPAKDAVPALASRMVEDEDASVRAASALALVKIGPASKEAVQQLAQALSDKDLLVRMNAALALQRLGTDARPATGAMIAALKDETNDAFVDRFSATIQHVVVVALSRATAGTDEAVVPLMETLHVAKTNQMRRAIVRGLGLIGPPAAPAVPQLLELRETQKPLRNSIDLTLQQIGHNAAAAPPRDDAELATLPESERRYLWEIEHHGNVLVKYGFGPLATAIRDTDRQAIGRFLADDFVGNDLRDPIRIRAATEFVDVERIQDSGKPPVSLDRDVFVDRLSMFRKAFPESAPQVKFALITLSPKERGNLAGRWEGTAQLRLAGEHAAGAPAEVVVTVRFDIARPTEQSLAQPGWLYRASVIQTAIARAPRPLFAEVAKERGLDPERLHDNWLTGPLAPTSGGVYVADYNRDGILDVLLVDLKGIKLYRGRTNGKFEDVTTACGLPDPNQPAPAVVAAWVDIDGDGWDDLLLGNRVLKNEKGARLSDFTNRCNFRVPGDATAVVAADYDRDGKLDLYVTRNAAPQTGSWLEGTTSDTRGNALFRNRGDWQFENVTRASGTSGDGRSTFTAAWLDANSDGWPDLHAPNEFGDGVLLVNQKNGTFAPRRLAERPADFGTMGLAVGDVNNDGHIDIYCSNMYSKAGTRVIGNLAPGAYPPATIEKMRRFVAGSQLHINKGDLNFEQAGSERQVAAVGWAYGSHLADLDSDGWLDIYATAGYISRDRSKPDG